MSLTEALVLIVTAAVSGLFAYLYQRIHHLENVIPHQLSILRHEIESSRSRMIEEVILNRQLDAYEQIQVLASNLVKVSINEVSQILNSENRILNDEPAAKKMLERFERLQEIIDGYQYIMPQSLHEIMVPFLHAAFQLIKTIKIPPSEGTSYDDYQNLRLTYLDALKNTYEQIRPHLEEMYKPVLDNLVYELPDEGIKEFVGLPEKNRRIKKEAQT